MDFSTHLVGHHFTRSSSGICSQHHPILQKHMYTGVSATYFVIQVIFICQKSFHWLIIGINDINASLAFITVDPLELQRHPHSMIANKNVYKYKWMIISLLNIFFLLIGFIGYVYGLILHGGSALMVSTVTHLCHCRYIEGTYMLIVSITQIKLRIKLNIKLIITFWQHHSLDDICRLHRPWVWWYGECVHTAAAPCKINFNLKMFQRISLKEKKEVAMMKMNLSCF